MAVRRPHLLLAIGLAVASCREATQMKVEVRTKIPCDALYGVEIVVGGSQADARQQKVVTSACSASGSVGSLVILPSGVDEPVAVTVVAGTRGADPQHTTAAAECAPPAYANCIVARRVLQQVAHRSLVLPVDLSGSCIGVPCADDANGPRTCVDGVCVAATIDPQQCSPECTVSADGGVPPVDAGLPDGSVTPTVTALALGRDHSCALYASGSVKCWGDNTKGQTGIGMGIATPFPMYVPGLVSVKQLSAMGEANTCALLGDGSLRCWGDACCGQLGPQYGTTQYGPVPVTILNPVESVSVGRAHVCVGPNALGPAGCWGNIPPGAPSARNVSLPAAPRLVASADQSVLMLLIDGTVVSYGKNVNGVLGLGQADLNFVAMGATAVALPAPVAELAVGVAFAVAATPSGTYVWGESASRQLGFDQFPPITTPTLSPSLTGLRGFALGDQHGCALDGQNAVVCWGDGSSGQLGPKVTTSSAVPVAVGIQAVKVFSGWRHSCAITAAGDVFCWGANAFGQIGDGMLIDRPTPVKVAL
jgi:alpha-tubulin suppressor-like RCC1 family protein